MSTNIFRTKHFTSKPSIDNVNATIEPEGGCVYFTSKVQVTTAVISLSKEEVSLIP